MLHRHFPKISKRPEGFTNPFFWIFRSDFKGSCADGIILFIPGTVNLLGTWSTM